MQRSNGDSAPIQIRNEPLKSPPAMEVNIFHKHSDVDSGPMAQHHTLGNKANQAAPGNHTHDGATSPVLEGQAKLDDLADEVVTGSKEDGTALANLLAIFFRIFGVEDATDTYVGLTFEQISERLTAFDNLDLTGDLRDGTALSNLLTHFTTNFGITNSTTNTPPVYPVTSVNTKTGEVVLTHTDVGAAPNLPLTGTSITGTTTDEKVVSIIAALVTLGATDATT